MFHEPMSAIAPSYSSPPSYDLVQLRYVRAIAELGSMTAAARSLRVSQPTLSNAVSELEGRLGTSLFLRGARGVTPTASGKALARAADEIFARIRQTDEEMRGIEASPAGRFVLGCYHSFGALFLPEMIKGLAVRAPAIEVSFWEGIGPHVVDAVLDRTVHFGVGVGSANAVRPHPELVVVPLFRDVMTALCTRDQKAPPSQLFYVPRIALSERVLSAMAAQGKLPERVVACGDLELVKSLVLAGAGSGILPWRVAIEGSTRSTRPPVRLLDRKLPFEVDVGCLFYRADLHRTRGTLLLRDEIVRRGRELDAVPLPQGVGRLQHRAELPSLPSRARR